MSDDDEFRAKVAGLSVEEIRERRDLGRYSGNNLKSANALIAQSDRKSQANTQGRQELRQNEALALARQANEHADKANEHADKANRIARIAAAFAVVAILISMFK